MTAESEGSTTLRYVKALDGLRAVAIIAVLLDHTNPTLFSSGQLGVDVFFTLSGFLITGLLLSEGAGSGRISLTHFYLRRALRLVPCMLLTIALAWLLTALLGSNAGDVGVGFAMASVLLYAANWVMAIRHAPLGFLSHTWSLAIEEQFYLVWAFVLASEWVRERLHRILPAAIGIIIFVRLAFIPVAYSFLWTIFRADELLIGAFLAVVFHRNRETLLTYAKRACVGWTAVAGLLTLAVLLPLDPYPIQMRGGFTLVGLLTAMLIAHIIASPDGALSRGLSWRPAVALGRVSYGVYLLHFPLFLFASKMAWSPLRQSVFNFGLTPIVVLLSWRFVEQPALRLKKRLGNAQRKRTEVSSGVVAAAHAA
jgi:peptidoglycan/LPS O-acetylase OafA/YrhL